MSLKRSPFETLHPERAAVLSEQRLCFSTSCPLNTTLIAHIQVRFWCVSSKPLTIPLTLEVSLIRLLARPRRLPVRCPVFFPPAVSRGPSIKLSTGLIRPVRGFGNRSRSRGEFLSVTCTASEPLLLGGSVYAPAYYRAYGPVRKAFPSARRRHQQETMVKPMSSLGFSNVP